MFRKLIVLITMGFMLSGCYMVPMALIGPTTSGFTTASLMQSAVSTSANYLVKKSTGKSISEHALSAVREETLIQSYFPDEQDKNYNSYRRNYNSYRNIHKI